MVQCPHNMSDIDATRSASIRRACVESRLAHFVSLSTIRRVDKDQYVSLQMQTKSNTSKIDGTTFQIETKYRAQPG